MSTRSRAVVQGAAAASAVLGIGGAALLGSLPADSVGRTQLKDDAVTGAKVLDKSLTGKDIQANTLGRVPKAKVAKEAGTAQVAAKALVAGTAYTTANKTGGPVSAVIPAAPTTFASLQVPAGSYVIDAKAQVDTFNNQGIVGCDLVAGPYTDSSFVQGAEGVHTSQMITNSLVATFPTAGLIELKCARGFPATIPGISQIRLTAVTVGSVVTQP
jgi:hypothetical protein